MTNTKPDTIMTDPKPDTTITDCKPDTAMIDLKPDTTIIDCKPDTAMIDLKPDTIITNTKPDTTMIDSIPDNTNTDIKLTATIEDCEGKEENISAIFVKEERNESGTTEGQTNGKIAENTTSIGELTDEYHYLKSGEYTSEIYKVIVKNLPGKLSYGSLRTKIKQLLRMLPKKLKFDSRNKYAFMTFSNEEERQMAIARINNQEWKGFLLECKKAAPAQDPFVRAGKRKAERNEKEKNDSSKKRKEESTVPPEERIVDVVCPYAQYSYEKQIQLKESAMVNCIEHLSGRFRKEIQDGYKLLNDNKLCLDLLPIMQSPVLTNYRNKVEFTIGVGPDGQDNTVGFRLGSYKEGSMMIVEASKCTNCSKESITIAKEFQTFIQTLPYSSYNRANHIGFWQQLTVRSYTTGEVMIIIQLNRSFITEKSEYDELIQKIITFPESEECSIKLASIYVSSSSQKNNNIDTFEHIHGKTHVIEKLLGLEFQISPDSFFQVNTEGAEILYQTVKEWCDTDKEDSFVLDVCCGTGTIGLCIAHNSTLPVVGVEICKQAVEDAKQNAIRNGVENAKFICGPAEKVLYDEIRKVNKKNVIAVVDPPRAGLHKNVISLLRSCESIKKIIYVSCSPKQAADNLVALCRPTSKKYSGIPFKTNRALPVDLFPQTPHCELIIELERKTNNNKTKEDEKNVHIPAMEKEILTLEVPNVDQEEMSSIRTDASIDEVLTRT